MMNTAIYTDAPTDLGTIYPITIYEEPCIQPGEGYHGYIVHNSWWCVQRLSYVHSRT